MKFQPGNPGGPGRPRRQTEAGYMGVLMERCSLDTWGEICDTAIRDAKRGDPKAREWLARYLVGEPGHQAPAPMKVVIQQLIGKDPALEKAAELLSKPSFAELV